VNRANGRRSGSVTSTKKKRPKHLLHQLKSYLHNNLVQQTAHTDGGTNASKACPA
jgi:hypothetical protein